MQNIDKKHASYTVVSSEENINLIRMTPQMKMLT